MLTSKPFNDSQRQVSSLNTVVYFDLVRYNIFAAQITVFLSLLLNPNCLPPALSAESSLSACMLSEQLPLRGVSLAWLRWLHTLEKWAFRNVL